MKLVFLKFSFILLIGLLMPVFCLANESFPSFPMAFWGNATVNKSSLPAGTAIMAYSDDNLIGEVTMTEDGIYGYNLATKIKLLIEAYEGEIIFKYLLPGENEALTGGAEISYDGEFVAGKVVHKDLNFVTIRACFIQNGQGVQNWSGYDWGGCVVISCNSGYYKSNNICISVPTGGGGGGGATVTPPEKPDDTKEIKGDIAGDGKVGKYDFALLMLNWGKKGENSADLNEDGVVDKYDFALLMMYWTD